MKFFDNTHIDFVKWRWHAIALSLVVILAGAAAVSRGMLPLGVLVAVAGIDGLFRHRQRAVRVAGIAVLLLLPIQFYRFYDDYFTGYPERSYAVFAESLARE